MKMPKQKSFLTAFLAFIQIEAEDEEKDVLSVKKNW
jgi:hypothetical protein